MERFFEHINLLIIPTNSCNLKCEYCFHKGYIEKTDNKKMSMETVEHLFAITFPFYKSVNIIWHGGEPLCMGIDFYKEVVRLQKKYNTKGIEIRNSVQTNMTLMTPEFASFFIENKFDVSTSYDGIKNEELRHNTKCFFEKKRMFEASAGKCGLIMVVSKANIDFLIDSYEEFKKKKISYIMNPYTRSLYKDRGKDELEIFGKEYAEKINIFFDYWLKDHTCNIYVKYFHEIIEYILFGTKSKCNVNSCLGKWICVRPDGIVTPCNRYFPEKYTYGNIYNMSDIGESFESKGFELLLTQAISRRRKCKDCSIFEYCAGGCNNIALVYGGVENNNHEMCVALREIYKHIEKSILEAMHNEDSNINPMVKKIFDRYRKSK